MAISNFPAVLQPIIQTGYLEQQFEQALRSVLKYRMVADREPFMAGRGETLTKTRAGLLPSITTPLSPATASGMPGGSSTNLDNGLTPQTYAVEQFTITINEYGNTMNLNTVGNATGIANQFVQNAVALGENAARSLDDLARNALFNGYMGGNSRVRVTLGANGPAMAVDDIRGFQFTAVNGVQQTVSSTYSMAVTVGSNVYTLTGAAADNPNISTAPGGISGVLTFSGNVTVADGTAGNTVSAATAPAVIRPNGRSNTSLLQGTDVLTMANLLDAKAKLELNAVPRIGGYYHCYLDPVSGRQLFADPDFKLLFQGATNTNATFRAGELTADFLGLRFLPTTEALVQAHPTIAGSVIRRPIICGMGALIEGDFEGQERHDTPTSVAEIINVDGVTMVTREPLDRLQQNVAQSWYWVGGFTAPTDLTTSPLTVATATNAALKRAVMLEHVG